MIEGQYQKWTSLSTLKVRIFNPRRACAVRVTVLGRSVCVCVFPILAVRAMKSITKNTIVLSVRFAAILKWRFS